MDVKKKLVELLSFNPCHGICNFCERFKNNYACEKHKKEVIADNMISNGVTVQEWIPASEPPAQKDADKYGRVLAMEMGMMALVDYRGPINYPDRFPFWMPLPQPPKRE